MKIKDVMNREVVWVNATDSLVEAYSVMHEFHFTNLPVVSASRKLVGLISLRDVIRNSTLDGAEIIPENRCVKDVMREDGISIRPGETVAFAANSMIHQDLDCMPVVNLSNELVGIISSTDLLNLSCSVKDEEVLGERVSSALTEQGEDDIDSLFI